MGKSPLSVIIIVLILTLVTMVTVRTVNENGAPLDIEMCLRADYRGSTIGSMTLKYHWLSGELSQSSKTQVLEWRDSSATASAAVSNDVDSRFLEYLQEATQSLSWLRVDQDGQWTASFTILVGDCLPVSLVFSGTDAVVDDISVACDAALLPAGLKTALSNLGITGLDLVVGWNLVISGDFLRDWIANLFNVIRDSITTVVESGSEFVASIDLG